jgi:hypothetical protein
MALELTIDMGDAADRLRLWDELRQLKGEHRFTIRACRVRTSPQNRLYWGQVVREFAKFLRAQGQPRTAMQCHRMLATKFLMQSVCDADGVYIADEVRSTTDLSVEEFSEYIENCVVWLADTFGIVCQMPGDVSSEAA